MPLHREACSNLTEGADEVIPPGARLSVVDSNAQGGCTRVRVTAPEDGEVTGLVWSAWLTSQSSAREPDASAWTAANAVRTRRRVAPKLSDDQQERANQIDAARWEHERLTAYCPAPNEGYATTSGNDKMLAAMGLATCTKERSRAMALELLKEIEAQCFQGDSAHDCPLRASVDDQRRRIEASTGSGQ